MSQARQYEMKDSGIEWIGKVPKGWYAIRLKTLFISCDGGNWGDDPQHNENDRICLRIADFDFDKGRFKDIPTDHLTTRNYTDVHIQKLLLRPGDLLIEKSGGGEKTPVGRGVLFDKSYDALYANFMARLRVNAQIANAEFISYFWRSLYYMTVVIPFIKQTTGIQNLDLSALLERVKTFLPPLPEQQAIAAYLDEKCAAIDGIIAEKESLIAKLETYKKSLIFETVTGKRRVC